MCEGVYYLLLWKQIGTMDVTQVLHSKLFKKDLVWSLLCLFSEGQHNVSPASLMSQTKSLSHTCSTLRQQRTKQCLYNVKCDTGHLSRPVWTAELNTKINTVLLLTRSNTRKKLDTCTHYMIHLCLLYKQVRLSQCQRSGQRSSSERGLLYGDNNLFLNMSSS